MPARIAFAGFVLDSTAFTLTGPSGTIALERLPMELLLLLAQRPGTLVSRDEIRSALWESEVHIEHEAAINTAIRKVRQALGDDPAQPRFVQTEVGKGYRFAADVRLAGPDLRFTLSFRSREIPLVHGDTLIGRDPEAHVCIDEPAVSRRHAAISTDADGAVLRDLGIERLGPLRSWTPAMAALGYLYGKSGRPAEARAILTEFDALAASGRYALAYAVGAVHDGLGDRDHALPSLAQAYRERSHWLVWLKRDPRWNEIRGDARFQQLVRDVGLPQ